MTQMTLTEYEMKTHYPPVEPVIEQEAKGDAQGQTLRLLMWLQAGKSITPLESWQELGIYRLSARIWDLGKLGYHIDMKLVTVKNRWGDACRVASYSLAQKEG